MDVKEKPKRTEYAREYYEQNREKRAEDRTRLNDEAKRAQSYWRQYMIFRRINPWLIDGVPDATIERERVKYLDVYEDTFGHVYEEDVEKRD